MKKLILIDGHSLFFRAYYATAYSGTANLMKNSEGVYTNALFAFINMMDKILENDYSHILIAFDTSKPTKRHELYDEYKAGREKMPEEMAMQTPLIFEYLKHKGIKTYSLDGFEADDIIGTLAKEASKEMKVDIFSSDRDLLQLLNDNTTVKLIRQGMTNLVEMTPEAYLEEHGISHKYVVDLKGLMGDSSDNIPGVPGVGPKTAIKLIQQYGPIEEIFKHKDEIKGKLGENLRENEELAKISYQLGMIDVDSPLEISVKDAQKQIENTSDLIEFYRKMDLNSFIRRMEQQTFDLFSVVEEDETEVTILTTEAEIKPVLKEDLAVMCEFFDSNYHTSKILGFGLSDGKHNYFISTENALNSQVFKDYLLSDTNKYTYDYKAFKVAMLWNKLDLHGISYDMLLASYLSNSSLKHDDFKVICGHHDYDDVNFDEVIYGKGAKKEVAPLDVLAQHVGKKAKAIYKLKDVILDKLHKDDLIELNKLELDVSTTLAYMEFQGINVNLDELHNQKAVKEKEIEELEAQIHNLAGKEFNVNSPKQLQEVLYIDLELDTGKKNRGGKLPSTNVEALMRLKDQHPIIEPILAYRQVKKLYSTYIEGIEKALFDDGKIHTIYTQALTATGRLSSLEPNLQNIPVRTEEGRAIRKFFVPTKGHVLLSADYSQIELRVLAHMSKSEGLLEDFNNDLDIHSQTAKKVFHTKEVTELERFKAKAVNFGIIYGMGPWSLAEDIDVSVPEAEAFIKTYFEVYPEIKTFMDNTVRFAEKNGYVKTIMNRRRYIPELSSSAFNIKAFGKRTAMNAPIQGSAADIIKKAMVDLFNYIKTNNLKTRILLQVHDELILEVPETELSLMQEQLSTIMNNTVKLDVKLKTSSQSGYSWYEVS